MKQRLRVWSERVKDFLWPMGRSCMVCGCATRMQSLCPDCLQALKDCQLSPEEVLDRRVPEADQVFSALVYGGVAKKLVWRTKFDALEEAGIVLGYHLAVALQAYGITGTLVTWVPMPSKRQRERGIDHAQLLAREVAQSLGVPCRALLARTAHDQAEQHTLSREERQENAKRAFCPAPDAPALQGEHILLIDDVLTTGSTASACAAQLRAMGAATITGATVCKTQMEG